MTEAVLHSTEGFSCHFSLESLPGQGFLVSLHNGGRGGQGGAQMEKEIPKQEENSGRVARGSLVKQPLQRGKLGPAWPSQLCCL